MVILGDQCENAKRDRFVNNLDGDGNELILLGYCKGIGSNPSDPEYVGEIVQFWDEHCENEKSDKMPRVRPRDCVPVFF